MIRRAPRRERFTVVDNETVRDVSLSWKARGLLVYLLSQPDNWTAQVNELTRASDHDGRASVRKGLEELEGAGYLVRERTRREDGTWTTDSIIHERPTQVRKSDVESRKSDAQVRFTDADNRTVSSTQDEEKPRAQPKSESQPQAPKLARVEQDGKVIGYRYEEASA